MLIDQKATDNLNALFRTAVCHGDFEVAKLLMKNGADINIMRFGETTLHRVCGCDCEKLDAVAFLLQNGAHVNLSDQNGKTPLHIASAQHHKNIMWLLVRQRPWLLLPNAV